MLHNQHLFVVVVGLECFLLVLLISLHSFRNLNFY